MLGRGPGGDGARRGLALRVGLVALAALVCACPRAGPRSRSASGPARAGGPEACPEKEVAPSPLPGVRPGHQTLDYWLARGEVAGGLDEVVLAATAIAAHNRALRHRDNPELVEPELLAPLDARDLVARVNARLDAERRALAEGAWVDAAGRKLPAAGLSPLWRWTGSPEPVADLRVAVGLVPIRCSPLAVPFFKAPVDPAFDRNLCAAARPQEPVQVLVRWRNGTLLARTRYALGWIPGDAVLSPPVPPALREAAVRGPRLRVRGEVHLRADDGTRGQLPDGALLLPAGPGRVHFATRRGWHTAEVDAARVASTAQPLTRRAVLEEAFRFLGRPYGWGDRHGGHDCSSFLLDLFASFGLDLPRNSAAQAQAGSFSIDLDAAVSERERLSLIDAAARAGVVLLHFPGHIMLYLGRTTEGQPMVIHSFAEYLRPCAPRAGAGDAGARATLMVVDRVSVSNLELGRGSERQSFLQRLTRIVILGGRLTPELQGVARPRAAAPAVTPPECRDRRETAVWVTPMMPNSRQPLRVIVASSRPLDPVEVKLVDPAGGATRPEVRRLGGPPYGYWVEVPTPAAGLWTAVVGDGERVEACRRIKVGPGPFRYRSRAGSAWGAVRAWREDTANLYSLFVEQLFDYPLEDDRTWPSLQALLAARDKNLLFDHLGRGEEGLLKLKPDCADLPHFLRAYFAWKLGLPFGVRDCSRGGHGRPPTCRPLEVTNLMPRDEIGMPRALKPSLGGGGPEPDPAAPAPPAPGATAAPRRTRGPDDDLRAIEKFIAREVGSAVHSGSGRTRPGDSETDYYPVPLQRRWLRPGAVFADPYGHVLVVCKWLPQGAGRPGVLVGADAQPDGTVGRRRFWRGTFLFRPETAEGGAGFKEFRPPVVRRKAGVVAIESLGNDRLRGGRDFAPWSDEQNRLTADDFYDRVDALTNPRPLDPEVRLGLLVDALDESVRRRVNSVDNGERYLAGHPGTVVPMPTGHAIFETGGPWEDFATPSRDMRLLIAIDTVTAFPREVARRPAHFGLAADQAPPAAAALERQLQEALRARTFAYRRSDGSTQTLTLADVVARARAFEVAYDPNDCVEVRWGAPAGSPEHAACRRRAPAEQQARMESYRAWFRDRTRPPR
ncbi:MAG: C40 family peptidase [Deltaproteobacteria bacterium]|nr:C40 family peptidase [Deltaproteobacteria bacterium]